MAISMTVSPRFFATTAPSPDLIPLAYDRLFRDVKPPSAATGRGMQPKQSACRCHIPIPFTADGSLELLDQVPGTENIKGIVSLKGPELSDCRHGIAHNPPRIGDEVAVCGVLASFRAFRMVSTRFLATRVWSLKEYRGTGGSSFPALSQRVMMTRMPSASSVESLG